MKPKQIKNKLDKRIDAYEITKKNQDRGKYGDGFHRPGSLNAHKRG